MHMRWTALAVTVVAAGPGRGDETRPITFAEARAAAERLAPDVLQAERREGVAEADVRVAGTWPNPTLTVESATITAHLITAVSVPLPIFGQVSTQEDASRAALRVARRDPAAARPAAAGGAAGAWGGRGGGRAAAAPAAAGAGPGGAGGRRSAAGRAPRIGGGRAAADRPRARPGADSADAAGRAAAARLAAFLGEPAGTALRAA